MHTIDQIERKTKQFAEARNALIKHLDAVKVAQDAIRRRFLQRIRKAAAAMQGEHDTLLQQLRDSQALFAKPKTRTLHGVRVGWFKQRGCLSFDDASRVVALIKKHFPDQAEVLIKTTETPFKPALAELPAKDLKRLGCTITEDTEAPFIKPADGDVDKLLNALLGDLEEAL